MFNKLSMNSKKFDFPERFYFLGRRYTNTFLYGSRYLCDFMTCVHRLAVVKQLEPLFLETEASPSPPSCLGLIGYDLAL